MAKCGDCKHFVEDRPDIGSGFCHRSPPKETSYKELNITKRKYVFPPVKASNTPCGEFKQKGDE